MEDEKFVELCKLSKAGNKDALNKLILIFKPLLYQNSMIDGVFDEDLYQELNIKLIDCIKKFDFNCKDEILSCLDIKNEEK